MPSQTSDEIAARLERRAGTGANSEQVAASIAATLRGIEGALNPIIGTRGVAALYYRSVHLAGKTHPWLAAGSAGVPTAMDPSALTSLLVRQTSADAAAGGGLLLHTYHELLASLIGPALTEQLLHSVWAPFLSSTSLDALP